MKKRVLFSLSSCELELAIALATKSSDLVVDAALNPIVEVFLHVHERANRGGEMAVASGSASTCTASRCAFSCRSVAWPPASPSLGSGKVVFVQGAEVAHMTVRRLSRAEHDTTTERVAVYRPRRGGGGGGADHLARFLRRTFLQVSLFYPGGKKMKKRKKILPLNSLGTQL